MPRRRNRRTSRRGPKPSAPRRIQPIPSSDDSDTASDSSSAPSSDVCDDYFQNLLAAGLQLIPGDEEDALDLARGLRVDDDDETDLRDRQFCPDWTLCERVDGDGKRVTGLVGAEGEVPQTCNPSVLDEEPSHLTCAEVATGQASTPSPASAPHPHLIPALREGTKQPSTHSVTHNHDDDLTEASSIPERKSQPPTIPQQPRTQPHAQDEQAAASTNHKQSPNTKAEIEKRPSDVRDMTPMSAKELEPPSQPVPPQTPTAQSQPDKPPAQQSPPLQALSTPPPPLTPTRSEIPHSSKSLSPTAAPFIPTTHTTCPSPSASSSKSTKLSTSPSLSPKAASVRPLPKVSPPAPPDVQCPPPPSPLPRMSFSSPADRSDWQSVETEAIAAYRHFKANAEPGMTYTCPAMPGAKARLAMHRAAEVLGCRSLSVGEGDQRRVVLTWTKNGMFPISEASLVLAVRAVLINLFPPHRPKAPSKCKDRNDPVKMQLREARKAKRKQDKLEAAVKVADAGVDPELVDILVERQDWTALELLYEGVKVPGLNKKKKKAKKRAIVESAQAFQQVPPLAPMGAPFPQPLTSTFPLSPHAPPHMQFTNRWYPGPYAPTGVPLMSTYPGQNQFQNLMHIHGGTTYSAANTIPIQKSNRGFTMLERMGWKQGEGLGSARDGITEPLQPQKRSQRSGLGS